MQSGRIAEEVVDVGKGAEAANAVKWSPARLRGLEGKGTEGVKTGPPGVDVF